MSDLPSAPIITALITTLLTQTPQAQERAESPSATYIPEEGVEVPMIDFGGRPVVEIWIDDHEPLRVIVDTGSTLGLALSTKAVQQLGLEPIGEADPDRGGRRYIASELRIGDALFEV